MAGPSYGAIGQADAPPPYEEPVYNNVDGGEGLRRDAQPVVKEEGPRLDAQPIQMQHDPVDGNAAHVEQVNCNVTLRESLFGSRSSIFKGDKRFIVLPSFKALFREKKGIIFFYYLNGYIGLIDCLWSFRRIWVWMTFSERRSGSSLSPQLRLNLDQGGGPPAAWAARCSLVYPPARVELFGCTAQTLIKW